MHFHRKCWFDLFKEDFISLLNFGQNYFVQLRWNWFSVRLPFTNAWNCHSLYTAFSSKVGAWGMWACSLFLSLMPVISVMTFSICPVCLLSSIKVPISVPSRVRDYAAFFMSWLSNLLTLFFVFLSKVSMVSENLFGVAHSMEVFFSRAFVVGFVFLKIDVTQFVFHYSSYSHTYW